MNRLRRWWSPVVLFLFSAVAIVACAGGNGTVSDSDTAAIRVGSKDFTEQLILGEAYALILEDAGYSVERKLNLGGTPVAQQALENGEIDLYP
ncbi:MAG: glycine betaine ABC transporter substrate-binding protein, partial [Cyanobacteria bacterium J06626_18]